MMKRKHINLIVVVIIGLGMPCYYKIKFLILGVITPGDIWHWTLPVEILFSFLLALFIVSAHDFTAKGLSKLLREKTYSISKFLYQYIISTLIAVITAIAFSTFFWNYVAQMPITAEYVFDYAVLGLLIPIIVNGASESLYFYGRWEKATLEKEKLRRENIEANYNILQNQVNPHFLFNSLNTLGILIRESKNTAIQFLQDLSGMYRYVLDVRNRDIVGIKEEIASMKTYANLMRHRFGDYFQLKVAMKETEYYLAPLTLQMLLENVFKHNHCSSEKPISIELNQESDYLVFRNTLCELEKVPPSGIGLKNLSNRYSLLSDKQLIINKDPTQFEVKVPLLKVNTL